MTSKEDRLKFYQELTTALNAIHGFKNNPWSVSSKEGMPRNLTQLSTGMGLYLKFERDKVHISCVWPRHRAAGGNVVTPTRLNPRVAPPVINCTLSRGVSEIACDILRRLLPTYERLYVLCVAQIAEEAAYEDTKQINWEMVREAGKDVLIDWCRNGEACSGNLHLVDGYGEARMESRDTVQLNFRSIPITLARAILRKVVEEEDLTRKFQKEGLKKDK